MTITIKLNAVAPSTRGVDFDGSMTSYFSSFAFSGWPYILGGDSQYEGDQIVLLDNLAGRNTKTIVLDGNNISYNLSTHKVSGTLTGILLGTLGASYKAPDSFTQDAAGHIVKVSAPIQITGLSIAGPDFHDLVSGLMNGGDSGEPADPTVLREALAAEAQILVGSTGSDTYTGTRFGDKATGHAGNDILSGAAGNDVIDGSAGNDRLAGGAGADDLTGGTGIDVFVFAAVGDSTVALTGRDTIFDFAQGQRDRIDLSGIDAGTRAAGDQAFAFIGADAFSRTAGELRFETARSDTIVSGDVNGDGRADFAIHLDDAVALSLRDFVL